MLVPLSLLVVLVLVAGVVFCIHCLGRNHSSACALGTPFDVTGSGLECACLTACQCGCAAGFFDG